MPSDGLFDASLAENAQLESDITALIAHNDASTPANVKALVEALEKAQRANTAQDDHINQQQDRIDTLEKRNAELGGQLSRYSMSPGQADQSMCESRAARDALGFGKDADDVAPIDLRERIDGMKARIAELESRTVTVAASDVLAERHRQISAEGWSPEHDDEHVEGQIADAAACYALFATDQRRPVPAHWPWSDDWWKQRGQRRDLVRAGALIIAEIERIDRAAGIQVIEGEGQ